jgi:hypothetical protein
MTGSTMAATCVVAPTRATRLRLTSRGRALILVLFLALAVLLLSLGHGASSQAASTTGGRPATRVVVVEPGQSLWSIAASVAPNADPRETIQRISSLNGLTSSVLPAGKALIVPAPAA